MLTFNRFNNRVQAFCQGGFSCCNLTDSNVRQELEQSLANLGLNTADINRIPLSDDKWAEADKIVDLAKEALAAASIAWSLSDTLAEPGLTLERFELRMKALARNESRGERERNPKINMSPTQQGYYPHGEVVLSIQDLGLSYGKLSEIKVWRDECNYSCPLAQDFISLEFLLSTVRKMLGKVSPA